MEIENWIFRKRPPRLERRVEFDNYDLTREFLDLTAELSEKEGFYPDMNFGRTHVSMTIHMDEEPGELAPAQLCFAEKVNNIAPTNKISKLVPAGYAVEKS